VFRHVVPLAWNSFSEYRRRGERERERERKRDSKGRDFDKAIYQF
jgi:hypothetical protein